jgi:transcriptional regulator GlxA family with amidase domain
MEIVFLFYQGMTALDAVGPYEILSRLPGAIVKRVAAHPGPIQTDSGLVLTAEHSLTDVMRADVLVIPGGGRATTLRESPETLAWVRAMHATTTWTVSVCTGSLILGAAGLLKGVRATTHWIVLDRLRSWGAEPVSERVVEDGKIMTGAGVSAGIDLALTLVAKIAGQGFAQGLQLGIEYDPAPPFDVGSPEKAAPAILEAMRTRMLASLESE